MTAPNEQEPIFEAVNLVKRFGGLTAVDGVSLELHHGQIAGLIGPNGAGKTTVFNLITGMDRPDSGALFFEGREITGRPAHRICRRGIARTFQNTRLPGDLTVLDNMKIACHSRMGYGFISATLRLPRFWCGEREITRRVMALLEMFDLDDVSGDLASSLPYGKRRNLEIARALATGASLILLDEPAAGLNPRETADLAGLIRRMRDEFKVTILLIEHDMRMVMSLCEWIVVLDYGKCIAQGRPEDVRRDRRVLEAYLGAGGELAGG